MPAMGFQARLIDDDPALLEQSYRLRYQVYCVERGFLPADDYPDKRERDAFDDDSIHVGAVDSLGALAATARIVKPGPAGLPLFLHCTLFPDVTTLDDIGNVVVEVSRVSISRGYSRRRDDPPLGHSPVTESGSPATTRPSAAAADRRRSLSEPFLTLLRAAHDGARCAGATHVIGATDAALHRWLVHYGFPYRVAGPEVDYYGRVAPYIMSLAELDDVILSRQFASLDVFREGLVTAPLAEAG